ncbi:Crp/Fnr family transcriptional regulator [Agarilytica rhodophyticola]|uniref:Crp/Fnr family transcriptional regulator n=1 Tax=Agarilytica rhodophyticola TaxID=1737490 RepID=UPI000B3493BA|nr:Crp/Fnr family transcriptional regulator [Agarilytica rhodophyticola]
MKDATTQLKYAFEKVLQSPIEEWQVIADQFHYKKIAPGEHWIKAGDNCRSLCFILEGLLRVYYIDQSGQEFNQHFYQENEALAPVSAIVADEPSQIYVQALEPTHLLEADYQSLCKISTRSPDWLRLEIKLMQEVFIKNARKEAKLLLGNAEQRYRWFHREYPQLCAKLTQYHIASFLGITPVSLSRLRKKIEL